MRYKEYSAVINYDEEQRLLHGRVIGIKDVVNFYGKTPDELEAEFKNSVEEYLAFCKEHHKKPDKPYSGEFLIRTTPERQRAISAAASKAGKSVNKWAEKVLLKEALKDVGSEKVLG